MLYICPMHPEIFRDEPGNCTICGMALEPRTVTAEEAEGAELPDMTRRFRVSTALALTVIVIATLADLAPDFTVRVLSFGTLRWVALALALPATGARPGRKGSFRLRRWMKAPTPGITPRMCCAG